MAVEIEGVQYSLVEVPPETSALVVSQEEHLLGAVNLQQLVDDLGRVGRFIRVAYNGVGAAGPKFTELQIEIQDIGYGVTKLCDKSALTVAEFKRASSSILVDLQATYQYLLDNLEEMAVDTLSDVSRLAEGMEKAALQLHDEFEKQAERVKGTLENTQRAKGDQAELIKQKQREQQELEKSMSEQERLMQEAMRLQQQAESARRQYEEREDAAISELGQFNPLKTLVNAFTSKLGLGKAFDDTGVEKMVQGWKAKKVEALQMETAERQKRQEALSKMTDFARQLSNCKTEENMADAAVGALHSAISGLKQLSATMMKAALFWKQMQEHCKSLAESHMKTQIERALKYPEEKRMKVWTSRGFKIKAVEFYAGWAALKRVCTRYMEQIKLTQQDLYKYLQENPTYEQSRQIVKELADDFIRDLEGAQKAIDEQEFEAQEEIKALSSRD